MKKAQPASKIKKSSLTQGLSTSKQTQPNLMGGLSISGQSAGISQSQQQQSQSKQTTIPTKSSTSKSSKPITGSTRAQKQTTIPEKPGFAKKSTTGTKQVLKSTAGKKPQEKKQTQTKPKTNEKLQENAKQEQQQQSQQEESKEQNNQEEQLQQQQVEKEKEEEKKEEQTKEKEVQIGKVILRHNHYKEEFEIKDNKLSKIDIDEMWYLSGVYKGNFQLVLKSDETKEEQKSQGAYFVDIEADKVYWLTIIEDEEAESKVERKTYQAPKQGQNQNKNSKIDNLTNELKGLTNQELLEKGEKYKQLIEARDLEDCLYN